MGLFGDSGPPVSGLGLFGDFGDLGLTVDLGGVVVGFCVVFVEVFEVVFGGRVVFGGFVDCGFDVSF